MKRVFLICSSIILFAIGAHAQIETPVKWSYAAKKINDKEAVLLFKATINKGWHIYSQNVEEGGPVPTTFTFAKSADFSTVGKTSEPKGITHHEKVFNMDVTYFENEVVFQQKIKLNKSTTTIKGTFEYMVCDDAKCLPPEEVEFSIPVK